MRPYVLVPYVNLHPVTEQVLCSYGLNTVFVQLNDDDAYRRELQRAWKKRRTVVIIEQDVVPWPGAVEELHNCPGFWCSCSYRFSGGVGLYHLLGCTKLSAELMRMLPTIWDEPGHWRTLDQRLFFAAKAIGQEPHGHRPPVIHLGPHAEVFDRGKAGSEAGSA